MLRVSAAAEAAGVPSATLVCEGFVGQAATTSVGLGMPNLPLAKVPGHVDVQTPDELRANVLNVTLPEVIRHLLNDPAPATLEKDPPPDEIVFEGSFEEVNRFFYENGWSDGLPIVPPTVAKIAEFLRFTDLPPQHKLGTLLPDNRAATVWNVAINGVMAGCRPEYMPVLLALVEALADPAYGVEHSGNTPGAETLAIINGPIIRELDFNYLQGALRDGFQANTAIGRFFRLYLRNVAGFQLHKNDKGTFGGTWRVAMAENEAVLQRIGWPTIAQDMGLAAGDNAVTIARYTGGDVIVSVYGDSAQRMLPYLAEAVLRMNGWQLIFTVGIALGTLRPLLVLSPILAETIARSGFSKADVQRYLFEHARLPASRFEAYYGQYTNLYPAKRSLAELVKLGKAHPVFAQSDDPERLVPIVEQPEHFMISVSGDPLRTNAYTFAHNGMLGFPTTKKMRLPRDWAALLRQARAR